MNEGEVALELRELPEPLALYDAADDRNDRTEEFVDPGPLRPSLLSRAIGPDHSLSVGAELAESSVSPMLLPRPPLVEPEPETRLNVDEFALMSLSLSFFSSKPMKIRERASLYSASRSSMVLNRRAPATAVLLAPPTLPASDASTSDVSASSPAVEPGWECWRPRKGRSLRRMIWNAGCVDGSAGTSSQMRRVGLRRAMREPLITAAGAPAKTCRTYMRLSER